MVLTLAEANQIIRAAIAKAEALNVKISVGVCDAGGRLMAFNRMDEAAWSSCITAQGKAALSAAYGRPSGELDASRPTVQSVIAASGGIMIASQGGVPIRRGGLVEGGCGVGGGIGDQDEQCAQAGVDSM